MKYIYINDFCSGGVFQKELTKKESKQEGDTVFENLCDKLGLRASDCTYILTDSELIILTK